MTANCDDQNKFHVAIVGSGPSGFYAAEALLRSDYPIEVDVFEKLPVPYGLVRFGVAPDHHKLKLVTKVFERIALMDGFNLIGNVNIGKDVSVEDLSQCYHAVIFANGAERERDLGIPGECLDGSYSAREFVAWYNGHPHYRDIEFDFSHETAAIIGQGNVALDVARILLKSEEKLLNTDIADYAFEALRHSQVRNVHIIGRRGPSQAKFSDKELREFQELSDCAPLVLPEELVLNAASKRELVQGKDVKIKANIEILNTFTSSSSPEKKKKCLFRFYQSPFEILGSENVEQLVLERNALVGDPFQQITISTGESSIIDCGLVFRCIGYRADHIPGLPYDTEKERLQNKDGRLVLNNQGIPGLYAVGWIKRGSSGTIGTNRGDSVATVKLLLEDLPHLKHPTYPKQHLLSKLVESSHKFTSFNDWKKIDCEEIRRGTLAGKPRQKITTIPEMINIAEG